VRGGSNEVKKGSAPISRREFEELLAAVRSELRVARESGGIDAASAGAVDRELDEVAGALPATDQESRSRVVVALKRAKGLVEGLAGLTEKVAAAIAAVHGLQ
jgi:adenosylhomocysteine nucleosidase